eukprot:4749367-Pyramimonas_sp.AAC.1
MSHEGPLGPWGNIGGLLGCPCGAPWRPLRPSHGNPAPFWVSFGPFPGSPEEHLGSDWLRLRPYCGQI